MCCKRLPGAKTKTCMISTGRASGILAQKAAAVSASAAGLELRFHSPPPLKRSFYSPPPPLLPPRLPFPPPPPFPVGSCKFLQDLVSSRFPWRRVSRRPSPPKVPFPRQSSIYRAPQPKTALTIRAGRVLIPPPRSSPSGFLGCRHPQRQPRLSCCLPVFLKQLQRPFSRA